MNRILLIACLLLAWASTGYAAPDKALTVPKDRPIRVAFVMSEGATMIDFAGPWDVFESVMLPDRGSSMAEQMPFELYTVGISRDPIHTSDSPSHPGMVVVPDYSFADAPPPDLVVVGAQAGGPALDAWLRKEHDQGVRVMSVCTGAFILAKAGLLDGKSATTHPNYYQTFAAKFPKVKLAPAGTRYVQSDDVTYTSGGETAGIDLALHLIAGYFGDTVAQTTADFMQYRGDGWK